MKSCMNVVCGTTSSSEWKSGWCLRSGDFALLCDKCGYAFDKHIYCEEFHTDDSGWRNCNTCGKRLHCGCIASLSLIELLDGGGVKCAGCPRNPNPNSSRNGGNCAKYELCTVNESNVGIHNHKANNGSNQLSMPRSLNPNAAFGLLKEGLLFPTTPLSPISMGTAVNSGAWRAEASWASTLAQTSMGSFLKDRLDASSNCLQTTDNYGSLAHPNLNMSLGVPTANLQFSSGTIIAEKEQRNVSNGFNQGFVSPSLALTPPKSPFSPPVDTNTSMMPQLRLARPPGEGRGRHQLLPRYWPRITDQELQQISGDSNCTIIPLFEKVLSASDAGRIGRLVLPKACAEAYFPHISLPEGLPIKIQDVKGKEWVFQFRFWPNNNSRMYVLEGVTPCIQSMQLQAGDTVTFSRKDPEGKLIMGYRKASNLSMQNLPVIDGCFGRLQSVKGSTDAHMNALSRQMDSAGGNVNLHSSEKCGEPIEEGLLPSTTTEKKKSRNIGGKSKRLHIDNKDVQALRMTWEEIQGMLRPPPNAKPSIVVIEDFEFEEYEAPPVFGKSSVFASRSPGAIEQWAQCDSCSKWRRIPADFLLPPKWTCMDNAWDPVRCFCSAPDELSPRELEFINLSKDSTKKRMTMPNKAKEQESSFGLSALANAAVFGDNPNEPGTSAIATTTKHPRHRPGCSCIVCIQPPSGKGKHCSTCTCTVCMTVKRRFKTLMMRKKNRQIHQGADTGLKTRQIRRSKKEVHKVGVENNRNELDHQIEGEDLLQVGLDQNLIAELADSGLDLNDPSCMVSEEEVSGDNEGQRVEEHPVSEAHHEQVNPSEERCEPENNSSNIESSPVKYNPPVCY